MKYETDTNITNEVSVILLSIMISGSDLIGLHDPKSF